MCTHTGQVGKRARAAIATALFFSLPVVKGRCEYGVWLRGRAVHTHRDAALQGRLASLSVAAPPSFISDFSSAF